MIYRVMMTIATEPPIPKGYIGPLGKLKERTLKILLEKERIGRVSFPPLEILDGWRWRARRLRRKAGIRDGMSFLTADPATVAKQVRVSPETIAEWQQEIMDHIR